MAILYIPQQYNGGYIALSYLVSFLGSLSTVELLQRRTSFRGLYNWYLLVGSAITMGGVATWSMHFIGNRAVILYPHTPGSDGLQLLYNTQFTALSFFVPILVLLISYSMMGTSEEVSMLRISFGGCFAGLSICGMHYLGQAGISNYTSVYSTGYVVCSITVAVLATIAAFTLFFVLRQRFTNTWLKRIGCAIVLAVGVSGMHWSASIGTKYKSKPNTQFAKDYSISRGTTIIIVIILSLVTCTVLLGFAVISGRSRSRHYKRAQKVVLALAVFDSDGRLMVLSDGTLPIKEITDTFQEHTFEDGFGKSHSVFQWIYRTSRNWQGIVDLLPSMRIHLHTCREVVYEDYSFMFREMFCVAAQELAEFTNIELADIGILYDDILVTGGSNPTSTCGADLETSRGGKGKFLFLVNRADKAEASRLSSHGFRFTDTRKVTEILARSMQISKHTINAHIQSMERDAGSERMLQPGVHLACFTVRPNVQTGFEVLVYAETRNQIPTRQLPIPSLDGAQLRFLQQFDGQTVAQIICSLRRARLPGQITANFPVDKTFIIGFHNALSELSEEVHDSFFANAIMHTKTIPVPCRRVEDGEVGTALMIAFKTMVPSNANISSISSEIKTTFAPLRFFAVQQRCYPSSNDHGILARETHREFSEKHARIPHRTLSKKIKISKIKHWQFKSTKNTTATSTATTGAVTGAMDQNSLNYSTPGSGRNIPSNVEYYSSDHDNASGFSPGIMVSQSISVHAEELAKDDLEMYPMHMGMHAAVAKENDEEVLTWVDELFKGVVDLRASTHLSRI